MINNKLNDGKTNMKRKRNPHRISNKTSEMKREIKYQVFINNYHKCYFVLARRAAINDRREGRQESIGDG